MNNNYYNRKREGEGVEMRKLIIAILIIFVLFTGSAQAASYSNQGFFSRFGDYFSNYFVNIFSNSDNSHSVPITYQGHPIPSLTLSQSRGFAGIEINVSGYNFPVGHPFYVITFDEEVVGILYHDTPGVFNMIITIPESASAGNHDISVKGFIVNTNFEVLNEPQPTPTISLDPEYGFVGGEIQISGENFPTGMISAEYRIIFMNENCMQGHEVDFFNYDGSGSFDETFEVPNLGYGDYTVEIVNSNNHVLAYNDFKILFEPEIPPSISLDPQYGEIGDTVLVDGSNFPSDSVSPHLMHILFDNTVVYSFWYHPVLGSFSESFEVPSTSIGYHEVSIDGHPMANEDFLVLPHVEPSEEEIVLSSEQGYVGDIIFINGSYFGENETLEIDLGGINVVNVTTNSIGSFEDSFIVPDVDVGNYYVTVEGYNVSVNFEVLENGSSSGAELIIEPTEGYVGDEVNMNGYNFTENELIVIFFDEIVVATPTSGNDGSFEGLFVVPDLDVGEHLITVFNYPEISLNFTILETSGGSEEEEKEEKEEREQTPRHDFFTEHVSLSSNYVKAGDTTNIKLNLMNTGLTDEEDMIIEIISPILGIHEVIENVLLERLEPSNIEIPLTIPFGISDGTYSLNVNVYSPYYTYEDSYLIEDSVSVVVNSGNDVEVMYTSAEASEEEVKTTSIFSNPTNVLLFGMVLLSLLILIGMGIFKTIKEDKKEF